MPIIFAENFEQDTATSIIQRYPGSVRNVTGATDIPGAWPLRGNSQLNCGFTPFTSNRVEILLGLTNNLASGSTGSFNVFGVPIFQSPTAISIAGVPYNRNIKDAGSLHMIVEDQSLLVLVDGAVVIKPTNITVPTWTNVLGQTTINAWLPGIPNFLTYLVVAQDTPHGTRINNIQWLKRDLQAVETTDWIYTDEGYVEDVDKVDPGLKFPAVGTPGYATIEYSTGDLQDAYTKVYSAAWTEEENIYLRVAGTSVGLLTPDVQTFPPISIEDPSILVNTEDPSILVNTEEPPAFTAVLEVTGETVLSPRLSGVTSGIVIDWGDGTTDSPGSTAREDHTYTEPGTYTVKIYGKCSDTLTFAHPMLTHVLDWGDMGFISCVFRKGAATDDPAVFSTSLVEVPNWLPSSVTTGYVMFYNCSAFTGTGIEGWTQTNITSCQNMFFGCTSMVNAPLFDTSKVTTITSMFGNCTNLQSVPSYNTSNVITATSMFDGCSSLTDVTLFELSNNTTTNSMFYGCSSLTNVPLFDLSSNTTTNNMFYGCSSLETIPLFNMSKVTSVNAMFRECTALTHVPELNTESVTNMNYMFYGCTTLVTIPPLNTSKVTSTAYMFQNCTALTTVPPMDLSLVTNVPSMFQDCTSLVDVPELDIRNATTSFGMFYGCTSLVDVPYLATRALTNINSMFQGCSSLESIVPFCVASVANVAATFSGCTVFNQDLSTWSFNKVSSKPFSFDSNSPAWSAINKPKFGSTSDYVLMHMESPVGNVATVPVGVPTNYPWQKVGTNATTLQITTPARFGSYSLFLNGNGGMEHIGASPLKAEYPFTIEFWLRIPNSAGTGLQTLVGSSTNGNTTGFNLYLGTGTASKTLYLTAFGEGTTTTGHVLPADGSWNSIALVWDTQMFKVFVNGVEGGALQRSFVPVNAPLTIGCRKTSAGATASQPCNGLNIDEFRLHNYVALYTKNYTPATAAFPNP